MHECNQAIITDADFVHLSGIQSLEMTYCNQATITGSDIAHLVGIRTLETKKCRRDVCIAVAKLYSYGALLS